MIVGASAIDSRIGSEIRGPKDAGSTPFDSAAAIGGEDVAAVKRVACRLTKVMRSGDVKCLEIAIVDVGEQSVVWANKKVLASAHHNRPARRAHARIDNGDVNRSRGNVS
jgi:hypothetical protein